jgi:hypothetical protein
MSLTFFTDDGTFGDATPGRFVVVNTSLWTAEDWHAVDNAPDSDRLWTAVLLAARVPR